MNTLIILTSYYETRFGLFVFAAIVAILVIIMYFLTKGLIFKYIKSIKSKDTLQFITGFHIITSLLLALILPNNFLTKIAYFQKLFDKNTLWIPASMIVIFFIILTILGLLLNIIFQEINNKKGDL